jgi:hypothetical protein
MEIELNEEARWVDITKLTTRDTDFKNPDF